jgi:hypothetical protein
MSLLLGLQYRKKTQESLGQAADFKKTSFFSNVFHKTILDLQIDTKKRRDAVRSFYNVSLLHPLGFVDGKRPDI